MTIAFPTLLDSLCQPNALTTLFQPIIRIANGRHELFAFECLTRGPAGTNAERAPVLFEYVRQKKAECLFDRLCVSRAFRTAEAVGPFDISVNVHASTLSGDAAFVSEMMQNAEACGISAERVIVEIVEHMPVLNEKVFHRSLELLRAAGFRIALDDVGLGHSNYKMIVDCLPDYFKIDRYFVANCGRDARRMAVLDSIARLADRIGGRAIGEGVEDELTEQHLRSLGIDLLQGYLYATPMSITDVRHYIQQHIHSAEERAS